MDEYNTVIHFRQAPFDAPNPMKLRVDLIENNTVAFVFRCQHGEVVTVPIANLLMVEHCPDGYVEFDEEEQHHD